MIPLLYRLAWLIPSRDAIRDHAAYHRAQNLRLRRKLDALQADHDRLWAAYRRIEQAEHGARVALEHERRQKPPRPYVTDTDEPKEAA